MNGQKIKTKGFTLVELIIVISILAILAMIAFVSFNGYVLKARDSKRLMDLSAINKGLALTKSVTGIIPAPDENIELRVNGELIGYQGIFGDNVAGKVRLQSAPTDPSTGEYYTYSTNSRNRLGQVIGFLEQGEDTGDNIAIQGDILGIVLDENNYPIDSYTSVQDQGYFDTYTGALSDGYLKFAFTKSPKKIMPFMLGGQLAQTFAGADFGEPTDCPENFIPVPGNIELGQPGFCIGKYEGSYELPGNTTTNVLTLSGVTVGAKPNINGNLCGGNGTNYHVVTLNERLTVANNIYNNGANWSTGEVGKGYIYTGNSGNSTTGGGSNTPLNTGESGNVVLDNLRQLKLSNGEIIWDFIGNYWELVNTTNITDDYSFQELNSGTIPKTNIDAYQPIGYNTTNNYVDWYNINDNDYKDYFLQNNDVNSENIGLGIYRKFNIASYTIYFITGGDYSEDSINGENGLFTLFQIYQGILSDSKVSLRCAYKK